MWHDYDRKVHIYAGFYVYLVCQQNNVVSTLKMGFDCSGCRRQILKMICTVKAQLDGEYFKRKTI